LSSPKIGVSEKYLLCLASESTNAKTIKEIKAIALQAGARKLGSVSANPSAYLSKLTGLAVKTTKGWELTTRGLQRVQELATEHTPLSNAPILSTTLRQHAAKINNPQTRAFVEEAIHCFENGLWKAAIVFAWVGAVAVLYDHVLMHRLIDFNTEARRRDVKWKDAVTADDLARLKEFDFLQILTALSIIGKNVKQELEGCLSLRNGCGHPNSLKVGENKASAHIETLIQNVFLAM
jgi:hypothetical protein